MNFNLRKLAIDLGTNNSLVYLPGRGIVINEPSVVAVEISNNQVMAIGSEAKSMIGRTPESIKAIHPLKNGVISSYKATQAMVRYFINKLGGPIRLFRPEIMISVPAGITSTEKRSLIDACISAGAKSTYVIKEPIAAALGAGVPIAKAIGHMIINIGGGTSEIAVISLGDIVASSSLRIGGNEMDEAIVNYVRKKYNLVIGTTTAENLKIKVGSALKPEKNEGLEITGSNSITGLPEGLIINTTDISTAIRGVLQEIILGVKQVLENTPAELASDVMDKGIILTGGGVLLRDIDKYLEERIGVPCQVAEEPMLCVVKGTGIAVENLNAYKKSVLWAKTQ